MAGARRSTGRSRAASDHYFERSYQEILSGIERVQRIVGEQNDRYARAVHSSALSTLMRYACIAASIVGTVAFYQFVSSCSAERPAQHCSTNAGFVALCAFVGVLLWYLARYRLLERYYAVDRRANLKFETASSEARARCIRLINAIPFDPAVSSFDRLQEMADIAADVHALALSLS